MRRKVIAAVGRDSRAYGVLKTGYGLFSRLAAAVDGRWGTRFVRPPIIVGGAPRSGTTLLLSMLSAHPSIWGVDHETFAFCPRSVDPTGATPRDFETFRVYAPLALARAARHHARWVEKTPRNVRFFGPILEHFGADIRLIHVVRDGRDVITSSSPRVAHAFYTGVEGWVTPVKAGLAFDDHPQLYRVRYEDLVTDYEPTMRSLLGFLDESWTAEIAAWHDHATVRRHTAFAGEIVPLHSGSVRRWQRPDYADRARALEQNPDGALLLRRLGYAD